MNLLCVFDLSSVAVMKLVAAEAEIVETIGGPVTPSLSLFYTTPVLSLNFAPPTGSPSRGGDVTVYV